MAIKANETLTSLPNIGKVLSKRLNAVGIKTIEELMTVGSENAFIRLYTIDESSCINELLALEGAIQGLRWHNLANDKKDELRMFYRMCKMQKSNNK